VFVEPRDDTDDPSDARSALGCAAVGDTKSGGARGAAGDGAGAGSKAHAPSQAPVRSPASPRSPQSPGYAGASSADDESATVDVTDADADAGGEGGGAGEGSTPSQRTTSRDVPKSISHLARRVEVGGKPLVLRTGFGTSSQNVGKLPTGCVVLVIEERLTFDASAHTQCTPSPLQCAHTQCTPSPLQCAHAQCTPSPLQCAHTQCTPSPLHCSGLFSLTRRRCTVHCGDAGRTATCVRVWLSRTRGTA
jgi:hypothetical protein